MTNHITPGTAIDCDRRRRGWLRLTTGFAAVAAIVAIAHPAAAAPTADEPVGPASTVTLSNAAQSAIIAGTGAAASGATCYLSSGAACPIAGVIATSVGTYVSSNAQCPGAGTRKMTFQTYSTRPTQSNPEGTITRLISNTCVPA